MTTDFNIKYADLSLTGNIPKHPKFLYEYDIPKDLDEIIELIPYFDDVDTSYIAYLNKDNERVIATNITPVTLKYRPIGDCRCQEQ